MKKKLVLILFLQSFVCSVAASGPPIDPQASVPRITIPGNHTIYANGNMQMEVKVDIALHDNPTVNWVKLYSNDSTYPEPLENIPGWQVSDIENEYQHLLMSSVSDSSDIEPLASSDTRFRLWVTNDTSGNDHEEICATINITRSDNGDTEEITSCRQQTNNAHEDIYTITPLEYTGADFELTAEDVWVDNLYGYRSFQNLKRLPHVPEILTVFYSDHSYRNSTFLISQDKTFLQWHYSSNSTNPINQTMIMVFDHNVHTKIKYMEENSLHKTKVEIPYPAHTATDPRVIRTLYTWQHKSRGFWNLQKDNADLDNREEWACYYSGEIDVTFTAYCENYNHGQEYVFFDDRDLSKNNRGSNTITIIDIYGTQTVITFGNNNGKPYIKN